LVAYVVGELDPIFLVREPSMKSKAPVVILIAIILMGAILWTVSAFRNSGGVDPERAKVLAEEAEKECVLMGHPPGDCPEKVGRNHQDCLSEAEQKARKRDDGERVAKSDYLGCMKQAFGEPEGPEAAGAIEESSDASGAPDTEPDTSASDERDAATGDTTDEETD
jgi:hypothetical protein